MTLAGLAALGVTLAGRRRLRAVPVSRNR